VYKKGCVRVQRRETVHFPSGANNFEDNEIRKEKQIIYERLWNVQQKTYPSKARMLDYYYVLNTITTKAILFLLTKKGGRDY